MGCCRMLRNAGRAAPSVLLLETCIDPRKQGGEGSWL